MDKLYYTIGEVAEMLGESTSLVRFWSNSFPKYIRPKRNAKGNRLFTASDLDVFRQIHFLVKKSGMTLEGAARKLASDREQVAGDTQILECLKNMKEQLLQIKKSL